MKLDERKRYVLQAIVLDYIATAEPVGSRSLSRKYNLGVSPATIRNEMADLEEMGFIEQPHTSAGRIPTNLGYRFYVDWLMDKYQIENSEEQFIKSTLQKIKHTEDIIEETGKILSHLTNYTALVMSPQYDISNCQSIHLLPYQHNKALAVIVSEGGYVEHKIIDIPESFSNQELSKINSVINRSLKGKSLKNWRYTMLKDVYDELSKQQQVLSAALEILDDAMNSEVEKEKLFFGGTLNILSLPEFRNIEKVKGLLEFLEQKEKIRDILTPDPAQGILIKIGSENILHNLQDFSIITATYSMDGKTFGTIGLLGPTRMEYAKAVAILELLSSVINKA